MKLLSFRNIQLCTKFAGMNEIEMLALSNDDTMAWVLEQVGFDVEYPVSYVPSVHRCMQNNVALGFVAVGELNLNSAYINSPMCTLTERMIASAYIDPSLTREMSNLMGMRVNFRSLLDNGTDSSSEDLPEHMLEPNREYVGKQIKALEDLRDSIRGNPFNDRGEAKTFLEYKQDNTLINKKE